VLDQARALLARNRHSVPFRAVYSSAHSSAFNRLSSCLPSAPAQPR
jgi:hypothetical protein